MAPPPIKSNKQGNGGKKPDEPEVVSNNLWVGNLAADVIDSDIKNLFEKHGTVDTITCYPSRSYAFVYLKSAEDAKACKDALEGAVLHGFALKIEFAKPAKPCKSLWVSGISSSVSKEELEEAFSKFGIIEDFKFIRDKNTAFVDYFRLEDASQALKAMNGKKKGGNPIRVDFLRSHSRREQGPDFREAKEGQFFNRNMGLHNSPWISQDFVRNYSDPSHYGSKRQQHILPSGGRKGDGEPSNVLWISYPPSVHIDEQMLHNAMILFGEIEGIRSFPSRHYSFVEFRSVEEAQRAKEGLQGQLFNDPRISIMFSSSELAHKDSSGFLPGIKGPRPDMFFNEIPFQNTQMEVYSQSRPVVANSFHGRVTPRGGGPDTPMRPFGPPGGFEPLLPGPEFSDLAILHKLPEPNPINLMGGPNWRRSSPSPGILSSPSAGMKPSTRPVAGPWDVFDASQLQRDPKRPRTDGALSLKEMNDLAMGPDHAYRVSPQINEGAVAPLMNVQRKNHLSPIDTRFTTGGTNMGHPDLDYVWRGIIAKGGTPVCRARCVPIGEWIGYEIPEVVNCSARTGLDMLAKHYADAVGFNIIFFLPDSEDDFASYTEFLRYLGDKNRAGVAKFDDGTTLFLVPPSDFLTNVLNVAGPERLYGVILKFPQHASSSTFMHPNSGLPQYIDKRQVPSRNEYSIMSQEERVLQIDYSSVPHEDTKPPPKPLRPPTSNPPPVHLVPPIGTSSTPQAGLSLTPELIATLTSFLPAKENSSNAQQPSGSTVLRPVSTSAVPDRGSLQGWEYERQASEQTGQLLQQFVSSFNSQAQNLSQLQAYPSISNTANVLEKAATGSTQVQDLTFNLPLHGAVSSVPVASVATPSHGGPFAVPLQVNQHYQPEIPQSTQSGYGLEHKTDAYGQFSSAFPSATNTMTSSNQVHGVNAYQPQSVVPLAGENSNLQLPDQVQQLQSALYGASQETSEIDADKNERYRSTLQFAANLLFQIHHQQPGTQANQGTGNH